MKDAAHRELDTASRRMMKADLETLTARLEGHLIWTGQTNLHDWDWHKNGDELSRPVSFSPSWTAQIRRPLKLKKLLERSLTRTGTFFVKFEQDSLVISDVWLVVDGVRKDLSRALS